MATLVPIHRVKMTAEQYFQLGEDPAGVRLELVDGEIIGSPSPNRAHAEIVLALAVSLELHIRATGAGKLYLDTDVVFDRDTVRRPDLSFYGREKLAHMRGQMLTLAPDLCVEVLSPSNVEDDRINKYELYRASGVGYYWIIDSEHRRAECFELREGRYCVAGEGRGDQICHFPPFGELALRLGEIWDSVS
jgi:Uma2 family endonuclease